jgi:hypothetical protein
MGTVQDKKLRRVEKYSADPKGNEGALKKLETDVENDIILFRGQGFATEEGQGDFDFPDRRVVIHPHDYIRYNGE